MKTEYDAIHAAGLVLQLDCPDLAMGWNVAGIGGTPEGFMAAVTARVAAINHATRDIPPEAMRLHLCWGNYEGPHTSDIPLGQILGEVLKARPAAISFEGANPRHEHEWAVFEEVTLPDGKAIVPGVIDSTTNYVEHPELVAQRIERYAQPGRPGERPGQQRLRLRHVRHVVHGRPAGDLGEAGGDGRGGPAGEPGALGLTCCPPYPPGARAVGRQQLAVVPGDDPGGLDDVAEALARGVLDVVVRQAVVQVGHDAGDAAPDLEHPGRVLDGPDHALHLDAAQVEVLVAGLDQAGDPRIAGQVECLLRGTGRSRT